MVLLLVPRRSACVVASLEQRLRAFEILLGANGDLQVSSAEVVDIAGVTDEAVTQFDSIRVYIEINEYRCLLSTYIYTRANFS